MTNILEAFLGVQAYSFLVELAKHDIMVAQALEDDEPHRQLHMPELRPFAEDFRHGVIEFGYGLETDCMRSLGDFDDNTKLARGSLTGGQISLLSRRALLWEVGSILSSQLKVLLAGRTPVLPPLDGPSLHG